MSKLISIIVPCYNVEKYIVRCLESLVNQTIGMDSIEIILVNDASTDETLQYLLEYEKKYPNNIIVINCEENGRQGRARNIGLTYATGDYIGFVDSDDFVEDTMYEELYSKAVQYDCDIVKCEHVRDMCDGNDKLYSISTERRDALYEIISDTQREEFIVSNLMGVNTWDKLYSRSIIYDNDICFPERVAYEDIFWGSMFYLYAKRIYVVEKILYHYCVNEESTVLKKNMSYHWDRFKVSLITWQKYEEMGALQKYKRALEYDFIRTYYYMGLQMLFEIFDYPLYEAFVEIKRTVLEIVPDYKNNKYLNNGVKESFKWMFDILDKEVSREEFEKINTYVKVYGMEKEIDKSKLISIIVPCYNVEKYIIRCLESLVNQTIGIEKLEIILVNDASTDNTLQYLLDYEKKYPESIIVIDCKENGRQGRARNIGLTYATGDYIGFVDSDDFVEVTMYEELYAKMIQYNCDVVKCEHVRDLCDGSFRSEDILTGKADVLYDITLDADRKVFIVSDTDIGLWDTLYKRAIIFDNNIHFPEKMAYEDAFWNQMYQLYVNRIYILEKRLYHYCVNQESTVLKTDEAYHFDMLKSNLLRWQEYTQRGALVKFRKELEYEFFKMYYLMGLKMLFLRFRNPSYEVFLEMKKTVLKLIPDYKNNEYINGVLKEELKWLLDTLDRFISIEEFEEMYSYAKQYGMEKERSNMNKLISVIIPCYNVENYIVRCMESLVNQTIGIEKLELIFINDASTDNTLQYILDYEKKYPDSIMVVDCKENKKQGGARNIGLSYATGEYIGFVDSDDFVEVTMYEELYNKLIQHDCDIVHCKHTRDYMDGSDAPHSMFTGENDILCEITSDAQREKFILADIVSVNVWDKLYKRNVIYDNNICFPEGIAYEDHYWGMLINLYIKNVYIIEKNLYHYCVNGESTVLKMNQNYHLDILKVSLLKWQEYEKRGFIPRYKSILEYDFIVNCYFTALKILFLRFSNPLFEVFLEMKRMTLAIVPNYKENEYIKTNLRDGVMWLLDTLDKEVSREEFYEMCLYVKENGMYK